MFPVYTPVKKVKLPIVEGVLKFKIANNYLLYIYQAKTLENYCLKKNLFVAWHIIIIVFTTKNI